MPKNQEKILSLFLRNLPNTQGNICYQWSNADTLMHRHMDFYEFGLVTKGVYKNTVHNITSELSVNDLFLFDTGMKHRLSFDNSEVSHFSLCVDAAYFLQLIRAFFPEQQFFGKGGFICRSLDAYEYNFLLAIANSITSEKAGNPEKIKLFIFNALYFLLQEPTKNVSHYDLIADDILDKIRNYTYLTCSIQHIYNQYPYSPATLIKMFRQRTGTTIINYQTSTRLDCAARFLRETEHSVEQIATNLGFSSASYFYGKFKKQYGMTPVSYRIQYRNNSKSKE